MKVSKKYYLDEVRDGFYIPGMMKRAWAATLEVYETVAEICKEHEIKYFAFAGTLLGTIRHGGFVPWDDDFDICMMRSEYQRFLRIVSHELPEGYEILEIHNDMERIETIIRIINNKSICFEQEHMEKFHGFPYITGIDIFPIDKISKDEAQEEERCEKVKLVMQAIGAYENTQDLSEREHIIQIIEEKCGVPIKRGDFVKHQFVLLLEKLFMLFEEEDADEVALLSIFATDKGNVFPIRCFEASLDMPFEGIQIPVPILYDKVLQNQYGAYIHPIRSWIFHDYPFYQVGIEAVKEVLGYEYPQYCFSKNDLVKDSSHKAGIEELQAKKEIVFLPFKSDTWGTMQNLWEQYIEDPLYDVYVIPIPYFGRTHTLEIGEAYYEAEGYPEEVVLTSYRNYDIALRQPEVIVTQNPYDGYNLSMSVHPDFYSSKLKNYTEKLIYIPYFQVDDIEAGDEKGIDSMKYFVTTPGVVHADQILLNSEVMKERYVEVLSGFAGEDTREIWEKKIQVVPYREEDRYQNLPEAWKKVLEKQDGTRKKIVLYYFGGSTFIENIERALEKMERTVDIFMDSADSIMVIWIYDDIMNEYIKKHYPKEWEVYRILVKRFYEKGCGVYIDSAESDADLVKWCDGYYGDTGLLAKECIRRHKPVMVQNVEV